MYIYIYTLDSSAALRAALNLFSNMCIALDAVSIIILTDRFFEQTGFFKIGLLKTIGRGQVSESIPTRIPEFVTSEKELLLIVSLCSAEE